MLFMVHINGSLLEVYQKAWECGVIDRRIGAGAPLRPSRNPLVPLLANTMANMMTDMMTDMMVDRAMIGRTIINQSMRLGWNA